MPPPRTLAIWDTSPPDSWAGAPADMTVTTLLDIEACPRRWALGAAAYPELWLGRGYPPRITLAAVTGTVVHMALERITRALVEGGCTSVQEESAVKVMKALGGYTKVLSDCAETVLARASTNPRASAIGEYLKRSLRGQLPDLRVRTQKLISTVRIGLSPRSVSQQRDFGSANRGDRHPLPNGAYAELELRVPRIAWKGKADLLVLSQNSCELTDFKTGAADGAHAFQLRVYALLWHRDLELNPNRRRANRLTIAYSGGERDVAAPEEPELEQLERELVARRDAAIKSITIQPPPARPSVDNCQFCSVRHLCREYWQPESQPFSGQYGERTFGDIELEIVGRHGPASWNGIVHASRWLIQGSPVLLRTTDILLLHRGQRLRILDASIALPGEEDDTPSVVTLGALSEVFTTAPAGV